MQTNAYASIYIPSSIPGPQFKIFFKPNAVHIYLSPAYPMVAATPPKSSEPTWCDKGRQILLRQYLKRKTGYLHKNITEQIIEIPSRYFYFYLKDLRRISQH